jgi:ADP-L-glycero-D-manno-heptose 6-epimerase
MPGKSILVTGGAGFIGSNICRHLSGSGDRVYIADWLGTDNKWKNLLGLPLEDIIVPDALLRFIELYSSSLDAVIHMGAISATTATDVDNIIRTNIRLTLDLWHACASKQIPLLFASSAAVYGDGTAGFHDSDALVDIDRLRPLNAYGWSKWFVDRKVLADVQRGANRPPQWASLRFFNVYGPGEDHKGDMRSVANKIYPLAKQAKPITLFKSYRPEFGHGQQKRDFVHVDDCVGVIAWLLEHPAVSGVFNVGSGRARSFLDLATAVSQSCRTEPHIEFVDMPPRLQAKYQYFTEASLEKIKSAGFGKAPTSLEIGIDSYVAQHLSRNEEFLGSGS